MLYTSIVPAAASKVIPVPTFTLLFAASNVILPVPMVRIPVIRPSPSTIKEVTADPALTCNPPKQDVSPTNVDTPAVTCKPSLPVCCIPLVAVTIPVE